MQRAIHRHTTDFTRADYGQDTTSHGHGTDGQRASHGRSTGLVLSRDACRAGACVFVRCSFCVRSAFGRVLCGVRLVLVRVAFVRGGRSRGGSRTHNGLLTDGTRACLRTSDGRATGGHRSDLDESSYPKMGGGAAADLPRTGNGHATGLSRTIPLRTDNGLAYGLITGCTRACGGISRGVLRTTRPTTDF